MSAVDDIILKCKEIQADAAKIIETMRAIRKNIPNPKSTETTVTPPPPPLPANTVKRDRSQKPHLRSSLLVKEF